MPEIDLQPTLVELARQLAIVLPDLTEVFEAEFVDFEAWETIELPFAVILFSNFQRVDRGLTTLAFTCDASLVVVKQSDGPSAALRADLEAVIDQFWPDDPLLSAGVGQLVDVNSWDYGDDHPLNRDLRNQGRHARAGVISLKILVGKKSA